MAIAASTTKQPFLTWDKVYQKLVDPKDEMWLLRACEGSVRFFETQLSKSEVLR